MKTKALNAEEKQEIKNFLEEQIAGANKRARSFIFDDQEKKRPQLEIFEKLKVSLDTFLNGERESRIFLLSGLRGAGKTTLLAQLHQELCIIDNNIDILFLAVDRISRILNVSLYNVLEVYQEIIKSHYESLKKPIFLFLDEIQFDPDWDITLKTLYDRSRNICIFATGSSALALQASPDLARRASFIKIFPLNFSEYISIKHNRKLNTSLGTELNKIIFLSKSASEVYEALQEKEAELLKFWSNFDTFEIDRYIRHGSLPFMISLKHEFTVYENIQTLLDRIINVDIRAIRNFSSEVLSKIPALLYAIADGDKLSLETLSSSLALSKPIIMDILEVLELSETLTRVYPHSASHLKQLKKSSKYFFNASSFRSMFFNQIASSNDNYSGKLLEDVIVLYLKKFLSKSFTSSLSVDTEKDTADFILDFGKEQIVIEVGSGKKDFGQVSKSLKKLKKAKYGLNISRSPLKLSADKKSVSVPLEWFLLSS